MGDPLVLDQALGAYRDGGVTYPRVTTILEVEGLRRPLWMIHPDTLEHARFVGTQVAKATQYLDAGTLDWDSVPDAIQPYLWAWERFKQEHAFEITDSETIVHSRLYRFAGRLDRLGWRRQGAHPRRSLIDIKTGIPNGAEYQTAAYVRAHLEHHPDDVPFIDRFCVQLTADGDYRLHGPYTDPNDLKMFLCAVALYHEKANKGYLILPEVPSHV